MHILITSQPQYSAFTCTNDVGMALEWLQSTVLLNTTQLLASGTTFTRRRISKITNVGSCWNSAIMEWLWGPLALSTNTDYRFPCVLQVYSTFTSPRLKLWNITLTPNLSAAPSPPSLTKQLLAAGLSVTAAAQLRHCVTNVVVIILCIKEHFMCIENIVRNLHNSLLLK